MRNQYDEEINAYMIQWNERGETHCSIIFAGSRKDAISLYEYRFPNHVILGSTTLDPSEVIQLR
jgi:hypothetical protein